MALWYGIVQGLPSSHLEEARIPFEPDFAWMMLDAALDGSQKRLRRARAQEDAQSEKNFVELLSLFSQVQEYLRPNFVKVVIVNKDSSVESWSPKAEMSSRAVIAVLRNAIIPVKLYSKDHELIWEGQFAVARLEPEETFTETGTGKQLLRKAVARVDVGDIQFNFEHQTRQR